MGSFSKKVAGPRVADGLVAASCVLGPAVAFAQAPAPDGPPKAWEGTAGVGVSLTSGNSDTMNYNLAARG